jgi:uncharacterized protein YndB with AHSA1/START domain
MPDILHEVTIEAAPDKVFKALTESQGLESWWATRAIVEPKVGSTVQVVFGAGPVLNKLEVLTLEPDRKVEWIARQSNLPEWIDTHITWDLLPIENGTKIIFGHRGYASADGCLPMCSYQWAFYLTSLKNYLETGKGNPYPYAD